MTDTVIKIGGSLLKGDNLPDLCKRLSDIAKKHRILIIPGGSVFADDVRIISEKYKIDQDTAHWMAILAMNQYGYLLSSLIPGSIAIENINEAKKYLDKLVPVVLLPYYLIKTLDPLSHSWDVTSDSIAAWITGHLNAERLILVKSIDIPYEKGQDRNYRLPVGMERLKGTDIIDPKFYTIMEKIKMRPEDNSLVSNKRNKSNLGQPPEIGLWIVNGNCPEQLTGLLEHLKMI